MNEDETMRDAVDDLLAAYALNACEPDEVERIERHLAVDERARAEFVRLSTAASWIGATEALTPPPQLRTNLLATARARAAVEGPGHARDEPVELFRDLSGRLDAVARTLGPSDLGADTANGLSVRDLLIHLAAMESLVAASVTGVAPAVVPETDIDARTAAFVDAFALRPLDEVRALWRESVDAILAWARGGAVSGYVPWFGQEVARDVILAIRSFETWIHTDDIRRALGRTLEPPRPSQLHLMAEFSMDSLPTWLVLADRAHPGRSARMVLTGAGGGSWVVPLGPGGMDETRPPDVTVEVDIVDWCHRIGERVTTDAMTVRVSGDAALAADILESASVLATL
jgi:uncharacterized protein (TIGR03083 family)